MQLRELVVIKRNGRRVPFDRDKLMRSLSIALRKRPVEPERVEQMVSKIVRELESLGESEVTSETIGEMVMEHLRKLDDVAYVRFASVYRNFREPKDFEKALAELTGEDESQARRSGAKMRRRGAGLPPQAATAPADPAADERFMQLALALGRRGLGNTWPNPAVGAVVVKDGVIVGRGWTQPGGRPHAETEALKRAGKRRARRDALRDARALLASRQDAALRRRHHPGRHRPRGVGAGGPQSGGRGPGPRQAARPRDRGRTGLGAEAAQRAHAGHIRACARAGRT